MEQFPHLKFFQVVEGKSRGFGGGSESETTTHIKSHRREHVEFLTTSIDSNRRKWLEDFSQREGLAPLDPDVQPILLEINPKKLKETGFNLLNYNIEIISENDDGYVVAASLDNLYALEEKINGFLEKQYGTGNVAEFWNIIEGNRTSWKPEHILSETLFEEWSEIQDSTDYHLEVGIAFDRPTPKEPDISQKGGVARHQKYCGNLEERDNLLLERQSHFEEFISHYGIIESSYIELEDSFSCEIVISGKGLKDLVINYPFVFEVNEKDEIEIHTSDPGTSLGESLDILPPDEDSPIIGVIDSGIQENHRLLEGAIRSSISYIPTDPSTADFVNPNGHGTRVAGAILYPTGIAGLTSPYTLPTFLRNIRVLDSTNSLSHHYPASLLQRIIEDDGDCQLFNLSISSKAVFRKKHMSSWASAIDELIHHEGVNFVLVTGNIYRDSIKQYLADGLEYPVYLSQPFCRIANPGQSAFAITVGSINSAEFEDQDWLSLGREGEVSPFSRIGLGIWDMTKPDVVEFGGGLVVSKNSIRHISQKEELSPELLRSTLNGGPAISKDEVGTSFAAPKVTHILAQLKKLYPSENHNLLRALLVQGARLPRGYFREPDLEHIKFLGYGLPSLERVTRNTEHRITFYNTSKIKAEQAHVYKVDIPEILRKPEDDFEILIEVTLAFTSKVRRTRQRLKSYLATWLDWESSKLEESYDQYKSYVLREIEGTNTEYDSDARRRLNGLPWKLGGQTNHGEIKDLSRTNSTVQKDWAIIKSYELPEELCIAVKAHKSWDKNQEEVPYAVTFTIEVLGANIPIYEVIKIENETVIET
ncbi:S8 family peptidase [Litoribacter ruber]|uniref:S8 family peptidase n=1 Tax=Litoribacter ruber TaxID=702568 RepID=UPI001BDA6716|nr:S8 family peptidase [Litoribacter ruber]MBT0812831.1 S8 family peptidase [Litoribacter ruber]